MAELSRECFSIFDDLQEELHQSIQFDQLHKLQNEAKFKAVYQNVESYEEFKEFVNAAQLQPLKKGDLQELRNSKPAAWNYVVSSQTDTEPMKGFVDIKEVKIPATYQSFLKIWQKGKHGDVQKFQLLKTIKSDWLTRILMLETNSCTTGHIITALFYFEDTCEDIKFVLQVLEAMSEMPRFQLSLDFLTIDDKEDIKKLFQNLGERVSGKQLDLSMLKCSNIDFGELEKKYTDIYRSS